MENSTNTFAIGDKFESEVFAALEFECSIGALGLSPLACHVFRKKGYYSRDRDANIVVDISIEVWPPDSDSWSFLWVCECKSYSHSVPVDDVEEFKAKLDQITGANRKGVIAISGAMQKSALKYAMSNGIGVVRVLPENQVEWVKHLRNSPADVSLLYQPDEYTQAFFQKGFVAKNRRFFGVSKEKFFVTWGLLLRHEFGIPHDEKVTLRAKELARREWRRNDS